MEWTVEQDGEYGAVFNPDESGLYEIRVTATRDQKELGSSVMHLRVSAGDAEFYDAEMRAPLLQADRRGNRRRASSRRPTRRRCPKRSATADAA